MDDIISTSAGSPSGGSRSAAGRPWPAWLARLAGRLPPVLVSSRFGLSAGAAAGIALIALLAVIGGGIVLIRSQAHPVSLAASRDVSDDSATGGDSGAYSSRHSAASAVPSPTVAATIEVDVVGKVVTHGVYHLPPGSRVADALAAAGGALPGVDLTSLDLASRVQDGDQIRVGLGAGAPDAGSSSVVSGGGAAASGPAGSVASAGASISPDDPLDLNAATAAQLDALPGIGPATAAKIVAWRDAHGPFGTVAGLGQIPGFSARRLATLTPLLRT